MTQPVIQQPAQPFPTYLPAMTEPQRAAFYANYSVQQKSEVAGVLFAVFLGGFGAHHFYLRRTGLGVLYLIFSVTGVPWIFALVEAFFMPGRVRRFNRELAAYLAASITGQAAVPGTSFLPVPGLFCPGCGAASMGGVHFCAHCGAALA